MRYAQATSGQRLHLVDDLGDGVSPRALCGRESAEGWRMTINVPLGNACRNCMRVYHSPNRKPRTYTLA